MEIVQKKESGKIEMQSNLSYSARTTPLQHKPTDIIPTPRSTWFPYVRSDTVATPPTPMPARNSQKLIDKLRSDAAEGNTNNMKQKDSTSEKRPHVEVIQNQSDTSVYSGSTIKKPRNICQPYEIQNHRPRTFMNNSVERDRNSQPTMQQKSDLVPVHHPVHQLPNGHGTLHYQSMYPPNNFYQKISDAGVPKDQCKGRTVVNQQSEVLTNGYSSYNVRPSLYSTQLSDANHTVFNRSATQHLTSAFKPFVPKSAQSQLPENKNYGFYSSTSNKTEVNKMITAIKLTCPEPLCAATINIQNIEQSETQNVPNQVQSEKPLKPTRLIASHFVPVNQVMPITSSNKNDKHDAKLATVDQRKEILLFPRVKQEIESPPNERCLQGSKKTSQYVLNGSPEQMKHIASKLSSLKKEVESSYIEKKPEPMKVLKTNSASDEITKVTAIRSKEDDASHVQLNRAILIEQKPEPLTRPDNIAIATTNNTKGSTANNKIGAIDLLQQYLNKARKHFNLTTKATGSKEQTTQQRTVSCNLSKVKREVKSPSPERKPEPMKQQKEIAQNDNFNSKKNCHPTPPVNMDVQQQCSSFEASDVNLKQIEATPLDVFTELTPSVEGKNDSKLAFDEKQKILLLMKVHRKKDEEREQKAKEQTVERKPEAMTSSDFQALPSEIQEKKQETPILSSKKVSVKMEVCSPTENTDTTSSSAVTQEDNSPAEEFRKAAEKLSISEMRNELIRLFSEYDAAHPKGCPAGPQKATITLKENSKKPSTKLTLNLEKVNKEVEQPVSAQKIVKTEPEENVNNTPIVKVIKTECERAVEEDQDELTASGSASINKETIKQCSTSNTAKQVKMNISLSFIKKEVNTAIIEKKRQEVAQHSIGQEEAPSNLEKPPVPETTSPNDLISTQGQKDHFCNKQVHEIPLPPPKSHRLWVPLASIKNMDTIGPVTEFHSSRSLQVLEENNSSLKNLHRDKDAKPINNNEEEQAEARRYLWADFSEKQAENCIKEYKQKDSSVTAPPAQRAATKIKHTTKNASLPRESVPRPPMSQTGYNTASKPGMWDYQYQYDYHYPEPPPFINMQHHYDYASYPAHYYTPIMPPDVACNQRMYYIRKETEQRITQTREYRDLWIKMEKQVEREITMRERSNPYPHYSRR